MLFICLHRGTDVGIVHVLWLILILYWNVEFDSCLDGLEIGELKFRVFLFLLLLQRQCLVGLELFRLCLLCDRSSPWLTRRFTSFLSSLIYLKGCI